MQDCHGGRACARDVVLVDVQLGVRVCCSSGMERKRDVCRVQGFEPDRLAPGPVVVERLCIRYNMTPCVPCYHLHTSRMATLTVDDIPAVYGDVSEFRKMSVSLEVRSGTRRTTASAHGAGRTAIQ